jgi:sulfonate transport system substrate-binding protein
MNRRQFSQLLGTIVMSPLFVARTHAAEALTEIRIGYQRAGILPVLKRDQTLEKKFGPQNISVKWVEFASGPPLLQALNTGHIDYGGTGDTPPIFAQAAQANLVYVAAEPTNGQNEAIIVPAASPIKTLVDLKGKKVGFARGSSSNNVIVVALEKVGLSYSDITPVNVSPADGAAAFAQKAIDAWVIWDPFLAIIQKKFSARVLARSGDVLQSNGFLLANRDFAENHPDIVVTLNEEFKKTSDWAAAHLDEVAQIVVEETGADRDAIFAAVHRARFFVSPLTDEIIAEQQATADRFFALRLIPKPIKVRDIVWKDPTLAATAK